MLFSCCCCFVVVAFFLVCFSICFWILLLSSLVWGLFFQTDKTDLANASKKKPRQFSNFGIVPVPMTYTHFVKIRYIYIYTHITLSITQFFAEAYVYISECTTPSPVLPLMGYLRDWDTDSGVQRNVTQVSDRLRSENSFMASELQAVESGVETSRWHGAPPNGSFVSIAVRLERCSMLLYVHRDCTDC